MSKKALVVLSGGQDSVTCLVMACACFGASQVAAVTFNYAQRHSRELLAARRVCALLGITDHEVADIGPILKGTSPLTDPSQQLETYSDYASMDKIIGKRVEKTFVPMRNALFLTLAANRAACMGATHIYTGVCQADNANYPDCRASFISKQRETINEALGDQSTIRIETPLMDLSKAQSVVELMRTYGLWSFTLLAFSHTAYDGVYPPVGRDHASVLRAKGFEDSGYPDPLVVRANMEGLMELPITANYRVLGDIPEYIATHKRKLESIYPSLVPEFIDGFVRPHAPLVDEGSEA